MEPRSSKRRLRVLCDLRPAFSGNSGIPNETRLMFQLLVRLPGLETIGLINHPELMLARTFRRDCLAFANLDGGHKTRTFSRFVAMMGPAIGTRAKLELRARNSVKLRWLQFLTKLGIPLSLDHFDGTDFGDFLWQALFSRSLPAASFDLCRAARYAALWPSWHALQLTANPYARIDTREFDVFIAQTPWPGRVSPGTQMIVRYHDAMPAFLPHTVIQSRLHQKFHLSALQENAKSAVFACVSEFSRSQLLRLFPTLEARAKVVYDCIAEDYFPSPQDRGLVPGIIASRIDPETEPQLAPTRDRGAFYDAHLHKKDFRFVLLVSTLEPRKNHLGFLSAWETLRLKTKQPTAVVFVGETGWNQGGILDAMRHRQARGELFHLSSVPASQMRVLYSAADMVICPSVCEGFDLPAVEAIRCGAAVAASDIPTHRELLADAAVYFNPYSPQDMSEALLRLNENEQLQKELRCKALLRAPKFDISIVQDQWSKILEQLSNAQHTSRRPDDGK